MYVQFYNSSTGTQQSYYEVLKATGLDFRTAGPEILEAAGIFPIAKVDQPYNAALYDLSINWDTSTGFAVKSWTPTPKVLGDVLEKAKTQITKTVEARIHVLRNASEYGNRIIRAAAGIGDTVRPARFDNWVDRISSAVSTLDTQLSSIDNAVSIDAINDIVSPAHGTIKISLDVSNPLNLLGGDFKLFYSKNYTESDLELFFPATNTTVAYSSGFAATASAVTDDDRTVQIRVTSTGVVVDEFILNTASSSSDIVPRSFGFLAYQMSAYSSLLEGDDGLDVPSDKIGYESTDPIEYGVTVSGGVFEIDGEAQKQLHLLEGVEYRFDQSDASNAGHPLRIYNEEEKFTEVVARVVSVGTPGQAGAYTSFIPLLPGAISYQCSQHSSMGGLIEVYDYLGRVKGGDRYEYPGETF